MRLRGSRPNVPDVALRPTRYGEAPARVLVIGGGRAGVEALVALHGLAGERVALELITPEPAIESGAAACGHRRAMKRSLGDVIRQAGTRLVSGSLAAVDTARRKVTLVSGEVRPYDRLLVTVGAHAEESIAGALTFGAPGGAARFRKMLLLVQKGEINDVVFAVPALIGLPLGIYDLTLRTAARLRTASTSASLQLTLITPEHAPLGDFGPATSAAALDALEAHGIHVVTGLTPEEIVWGALRARPANVRVNADIVITLPRMRGPALLGLPADERGFVVVDTYGLVGGSTDVYAAGDATTMFPIKDAGLAAQQALGVAETIAASVGVPLAPRPFHPVLHGILPGIGESSESVAVGAAGNRVRPGW
jgi:sulfide:quinone oxidoreductase